MGLFVLGISHQKASVEIREQVSLVPEQIDAFLTFVRQQKIAKEAVVLSTCNRTELYFYQLKKPLESVISGWAEHTSLSSEELSHYLYQLEGAAAAEHLFRVAAGLDSLILGEPQIFGQLKQALAQSVRHEQVGKYLNHLFQLSFNVAKEIRTETNIGAFAVSVAFTAVQLARQIFDGLADYSVLLVGAGETTELVARHLLEAGVERIDVVNRSIERAESLIETLGIEGESSTLDALPQFLPKADIVVSSTAADHALITKTMAKEALKKRAYQPMLMIDLAVPRDIEAEVGKLDDLYLYTVDDLNMIVADNQKSREEAALEAERYVQRGVGRWQEWLLVADMGQRLAPIEARNRKMIERSMRRARNQLAQNENVDDVLAQYGRQLTQRIMHPFISYIKALESGEERAILEKLLKEFE